MIYQKPLFYFLFFLLLAIAILQKVAITFYLYWTLPWFDILMHFLGGFWFGLLILWILFLSGYVKAPRLTTAALLTAALSFAIGIGLIWEIFEYATGITFVVNNHTTDTVIDIIMDTVGGIVSVLFFSWYMRKHEISQT